MLGAHVGLLSLEELVLTPTGPLLFHSGFLCPFPSQRADGTESVPVAGVGMSDSSGPVVGWSCVMRNPTPSQRRAGQQWSGPALAPRWGDVPPAPVNQGRAGDCVGSPCAPPPTPTPPGVNLGASTEPLGIPTCEESWGRHTPSIMLGCAYILETE